MLGLVDSSKIPARALVITGWGLVAAAVLWAWYAVLWVYDLALSPGGDTHWRNPLFAGVLILALLVSAIASVALGVRRLRRDGDSVSVIWFLLAVVVAVVSAVPLPFLAIVSIP